MRYLTPLLPPGEIFQSNSISKSWKVSSVNKSSSILGCGSDLMQPSSILNPSPGGDFLDGSSHPANELPSKSRRHPAAFSSAASTSLSSAPCLLTSDWFLPIRHPLLDIRQNRGASLLRGHLRVVDDLGP